MRLALLHYTCPPVIGGVERILADHARLFTDAGHQVTVIAGEGSPAWTADRNIEVLILPEIRRAASGIAPPSLEAVLSPILLRHDVVFLHNVLTMPFHPSLTTALWQWAGSPDPRPRLIAWVHDVAATNPEYRPVPELLRRAHPSIEYVAVSRHRKKELCASTSLEPERCRVIPNGIDGLERLQLTQNCRALAEKHRLLERECVLLHPTRLLRRKNVETSLRVLAELVETSQSKGNSLGPLLLITGAPDPHHPASAAYATELRALGASLGIEDHVCWVGDQFHPTDADMDGLYSLSDALFYPSHQEGFGLPVLEAALHRLSVFCSEREPLTSLLPAENVTFFPADQTPAEIAATVRRQFEVSGTIRNRKAVVRSYGWPAVYQNYLAPLLARTEAISHP
jgi:glycosyltransferase involved in cell wall biosynthesis